MSNIYNLEIPKVTDGKSFNTAIKPRLLFINSVPLTDPVYYGLDYTTNDPDIYNIENWWTLSNKLNLDINAEDNLSLKFDNKDTYTDDDLVNNDTIYNKFYLKDININLSNKSYIIECKLKLTKYDIDDLDFSDIIYIKSNKIGSGNFILNSIKKYVADGFSTVELIKPTLEQFNYSKTITSNIITRTLLTTNEVVGSSSTSSTSNVSSNTSNLAENIIVNVGDFTGILKDTNNNVQASLKAIDEGIIVSSQWITNTNGDIYYNGNVGIGTDTTTAKLGFGTYYINTATPTADQQTSHIRLYDSGNGGVNYGIGVSTNALNIAANQSTGTIRLYTAGTEKIRIDSNGNIGIGTTSPNSLLSLGNAVDAQKLLLYDNSNNYKYGFGIQSNELRTFFPSDGGFATWGSISTADGTSFSEKIRIDNDGNVGIGTTSPGSIFEIAKNAVESIPSLGSNSSHFQITNVGEYGLMAGILGSGSSYIQSQRFDGTATAYNLLLQPNGGNVTIGSTNAVERLQVYNLVNTNFHAEPTIGLSSDRGDYYSAIGTYRGGGSQYIGLSFFTSNNSTLTNRINILPDGKLDILGYGKDTDFNNSNNYFLKIRNNQWLGSQISGIEFWNGGAKTVPTSRIISQMAGSGAGGENLYFQTQPSNSTNPNPLQPTTKVTIKNSGDVSFKTSLTAMDTAFGSGFVGSGWKIWESSTDIYDLEIDNLRVRKRMDVYELVINKIRATNGSLWVSDSMKVDYIIGYGAGVFDIYVDYDKPSGGNPRNPQPFVVNDIIRCQQWTGKNVKYYSGTVTATDDSGEFFKVTLNTGYSTPEIGDVIVRVGNTSDTDRQGAIYLTSSDSNAPYIDVIDGMTSNAITTDKIKVRLGKLDGITFNGNDLSGYGLYSDNVYLNGEIIASSGNIGGWDITSEKITKTYDTYTQIRMATECTSAPKGFSVYRSNASLTNGNVKIVTMGQLYQQGNHLTFGTDYGFQIKTYHTSGDDYRDLLYIGSDAQFIAGWNLNETTLSSRDGRIVLDSYNKEIKIYNESNVKAISITNTSQTDINDTGFSGMSQTEISAGGFLSYWDENRFFRIKKDGVYDGTPGSSSFLYSKGSWRHESDLGIGGSLFITENVWIHGDVHIDQALVLQGNASYIHLSPISTTPLKPSEGDIYYDFTNHSIKFYNGTGWSTIAEQSF